jgi:hypothetical protein
MEEEETVEAFTVQLMMIRRTCVLNESHALSIMFLLVAVG